MVAGSLRWRATTIGLCTRHDPSARYPGHGRADIVARRTESIPHDGIHARFSTRRDGDPCRTSAGPRSVPRSRDQARARETRRASDNERRALARAGDLLASLAAIATQEWLA